MKANYKIENSTHFSDFHKKILVYNYKDLNTIVNLPCIKDSSLINYYSDVLIGIWKIKELKK